MRQQELGAVFVDVLDFLRLRGDNLYRAHENVGDDRDAEEQVYEGKEVG